MSFHSEIPHSLLLYGQDHTQLGPFRFFPVFLPLHKMLQCPFLHSVLILCQYSLQIGLVIHLRMHNLYPHQHSRVPDSYHP